jgi:hypothetical protein
MDATAHPYRRCSLIKIVSWINGPCFPTFGEALTVQLATSLTISLQIDCFILKGDSLIVIMALQNPLIIQDWIIYSLIANINDSIPASFAWKAWNTNFSDNYATKWAAMIFYSVCIFIYPPFPSPSIQIVSRKEPLPSCSFVKTFFFFFKFLFCILSALKEI